MKNKEIEELLNKLKDVAKRHTIEVREYGVIETIPQSISKELRLNSYSANLLLSYIEQLEKENQQLKKQKDDVVKYIKSNCILSDEWTELGFCNFIPTGKINYKALNKEKIKDLLRMLGEIDDSN